MEKKGGYDFIILTILAIFLIARRKNNAHN